MGFLSFIESLSLVEWVIFGFICLNLALPAVYLIQRGFEKAAASKAE